jgi:hypothetical protein
MRCHARRKGLQKVVVERLLRLIIPKASCLYDRRFPAPYSYSFSSYRDHDGDHVRREQLATVGCSDRKS